MAKLNEVSTKLYQQAGAQAQQNQQAGPDMGGQAGPNMGGQAGQNQGQQNNGGFNDDNVVDADYTVVDDDK